jgi:hypothetical protein
MKSPLSEFCSHKFRFFGAHSWAAASHASRTTVD